MCFLKTLKPLDQMPTHKEILDFPPFPQKENTSQQQKPSFLNLLLNSETPLLLNKNDQLLFKLLSLATANHSVIRNLEQVTKNKMQKLNYNELLLDNSCQHFSQMEVQTHLTLPSLDSSQIQIGEITHDQEDISAQPLITKIFGKRKYQYRLQLDGEVADVIYKERNIKIGVKLIDLNSQQVLNCTFIFDSANIIHLCLGVCDANGQWVMENRVGQNFMKGKTEVQMYHGEGAFLKVYPRDVSRVYPEGKLNFVVYSKPSMLKFTSNASSLEQVVDSSLIEPLLIKDISIKAKKKD